jgi:hypothetical protein
MQNVTPLVIAIAVLELAPAVAFGLASQKIAEIVRTWPRIPRLATPGLLAIPYVVLAMQRHAFRWGWLALYFSLPIVLAGLLLQASAEDPEQRGNWRDALILLTLGLAVDLRWFDSAWPDGLRGTG